jgi:hypothetical protein
VPYRRESGRVTINLRRGRLYERAARYASDDRLQYLLLPYPRLAFTHALLQTLVDQFLIASQRKDGAPELVDLPLKRLLDRMTQTPQRHWCIWFCAPYSQVASPLHYLSRRNVVFLDLGDGFATSRDGDDGATPYVIVRAGWSARVLDAVVRYFDRGARRSVSPF